jgi:histidine triad (HIT) family protein
MPTIFTKIVNGDIPSYRIAEDDRFYAFLDINPVAIGHTLVIPKKEMDYLFDIEDKLYGDFFLFAKKVAIGLKKAIPCEKVGLVVIGLEVLHAHIHLIPLNTMDDVNFSKPKLKLSAEEFREIRAKVSEALKQIE